MRLTVTKTSLWVQWYTIHSTPELAMVQNDHYVFRASAPPGGAGNASSRGPLVLMMQAWLAVQVASVPPSQAVDQVQSYGRRVRYLERWAAAQSVSVRLP